MPVRVHAEGLDHPEGVTVDAAGRLYAGGEAGQVYLVEQDGRVRQVASTGGFLLGLCADADGLLYCCDTARRAVLRVDPTSGQVEEYTRGAPDRPLVTPNWPVFAADGTLYVTDSGHWQGDDGCVLRVEPGGATQVWSTASSDFPNGAALSADRSALLVLESCTPALVRLPIGPDGRAGHREVVAELPGTVPDGVTVCADGSVYVFCYRPDRILHVGLDGAVTVVADDPQGTLLAAPTNGVWVDDLRTLVTGNLGRWHLSALTPGRTGLPLLYPRVRR